MVPNPGFEDYTFLPFEIHQLDRCKEWINPSPKRRFASIPPATPDYFHAQGGELRGVRLPETRFSYIDAHGGEAIAGILTRASWEYREYLQAKLLDSLEIGRRYKVSMWVSNGQNYFHGCASSHNIAMLLSTDRVVQNLAYPIERTPQLRIEYGLWTTKWIQLSFEIEADSAYRYLTIGNFNSNSETSSSSVTSNCETKGQSYLFVDDVEVVDVSPVLTASADTSICAGDSLLLTAAYGKTYSWWINENDIISVDSFINIKPEVSTVYFVSDARDTIQIRVKVSKPPLLSLGPDSVLCYNKPIEYNFSHSTTNYLWEDGTSQSNRQISQSGLYWLEARRGSCVVRDSVNIQVIPKTNVYLPKDTTICYGDTIFVHQKISGDSFLYYWNNQYIDTSVAISNKGDYSFTLSDRCEEVDYAFRVNTNWCNCKVYIPNAFSPNVDIRNDFFGPISNCPIENYYMVVLSLWGEVIFETTDVQNRWDGKYKGKLCQPDLYLYKIEYNDTKRTGVVNLFR